jgi:hypothetical protein
MSFMVSFFGFKLQCCVGIWGFPIAPLPVPAELVYHIHCVTSPCQALPHCPLLGAHVAADGLGLAGLNKVGQNNQ